MFTLDHHPLGVTDHSAIRLVIDLVPELVRDTFQAPAPEQTIMIVSMVTRCQHVTWELSMELTSRRSCSEVLVKQVLKLVVCVFHLGSPVLGMVDDTRNLF